MILVVGKLHAETSMSRFVVFSTPRQNFLTTLAHFVTVFGSASLLFRQFVAEKAKSLT